MTDKIPEHVDILGQPLKEGSYVAVSQSNIMYVCQIKKVTPKQIRVCPIKGRYSPEWAGWLKYPSDSVLLSGPDVLVYILKNSGS
jgi:hypothetical protein